MLPIAKQQGFSLLEILMAFSIMAMALGILLNIFSGGVKTAMVAEDYTVAVQIAESLMAKAGTEIPLKPHHSNGEESDKYRWSLEIAPYTLSSSSIDLQAVRVELYKVSASVVWGEFEKNTDDREIRLTTLKIASKNNVLP